MGNSRIDPYSRILKRELFRKWMEQNYTKDDAMLVVGISADEAHRMDRIKENWKRFKRQDGLYVGPYPIN